MKRDRSVCTICVAMNICIALIVSGLFKHKRTRRPNSMRAIRLRGRGASHPEPSTHTRLVIDIIRVGVCVCVVREQTKRCACGWCLVQSSRATLIWGLASTQYTWPARHKHAHKPGQYTGAIRAVCFVHDGGNSDLGHCLRLLCVTHPHSSRNIETQKHPISCTHRHIT